LAEGENLIGRDPSSAVWLDAAGVSRRHARIVVDGAKTMLEDLGSKNGTTIRGSEVTGSAVLRDGDEVRIGPVVILYRAAVGGASTETVTRGRQRRARTPGETHGTRSG
jgi:pSer/pThr/pTyr-binding forkhead associated (FHA) protein